jgi:hypothetical protein
LFRELHFLHAPLNRVLLLLHDALRLQSMFFLLPEALFLLGSRFFAQHFFLTHALRP